MGNAVLPALSGVGYSVVRKPRAGATLIQTSASGKETRIALWSTPINDFELSYDFLWQRQPYSSIAGVPYASSIVSVDPLLVNDWSILEGFFKARQGAFDDFLFEDIYTPDNQCSGQPFGTGDGTTTQFQLIRTLGPYDEPISEFQPPDGINLCPDSNIQFGSQFWSIAGALTIATGGSPIDGGNAFEFVGSGGASSYSYAKSAVIAVTPGTEMTLSGYIDASAVEAGGSVPIWGVYDPALTTSYASASVSAGNAGNTTATFTVPAGVYQVVVLCDTNNAPVARGGTLRFAAPQLSVGSVAMAYRPSTNPTIYGWQPVSSLSPSGIVSFATAPPPGTIITWSGKYYFRVRFAQDLAEFELFMENFLRWGKVELTGVKP